MNKLSSQEFIFIFENVTVLNVFGVNILVIVPVNQNVNISWELNFCPEILPYILGKKLSEQNIFF